jgi:sec-independent protein translocase protein TatC
MNEEEKQPFTSHLDELRKRLITCFAAVGIGFAASYAFKEKLFYILVAPLQKVMHSGDTLIYTHLPEAFFTFLKTALISGIL